MPGISNPSLTGPGGFSDTGGQAWHNDSHMPPTFGKHDRSGVNQRDEKHCGWRPPQGICPKHGAKTSPSQRNATLRVTTPGHQTKTHCAGSGGPISRKGFRSGLRRGSRPAFRLILRGRLRLSARPKAIVWEAVDRFKSRRFTRSQKRLAPPYVYPYLFATLFLSTGGNCRRYSSVGCPRGAGKDGIDVFDRLAKLVFERA